MPDVYAQITEVDPATAELVADAMELRAADPQQRAMLMSYLEDLALAGGARVLEIGCGTGAISRVLAGRPEVAEVVGIDPSPLLLVKARHLSSGVPGLSFTEADGRDLPVLSGTFDGVVLHTVLSHVPGPEHVLAEAFRVLRPGGRLAAFDGDYATITLAAGESDPLQACCEAFAAGFIHDRWLVRRLPALVRAAGFRDVAMRSHGYLQTSDPAYMLSIADRGADTLVATGRIGHALGEALRAEARRRVGEHAFFGHIAYASLTATRRA